MEDEARSSTQTMLLPADDSGEEERALGSSLELALSACMSQLKALRSGKAGEHHFREYAAEEHALKLSLSGIIARLQALRVAGNARRSELLLTVVPQTVNFLCVRDALQLSQVSSSARAASVIGGGSHSFLLVPHLDRAPESPRTRQRFFADLALSSVRSVKLELQSTAQLLREHAAMLDSVDTLVLPHGFLDFDALIHLVSLRSLHVDAGCTDFDAAAAARLSRVLASCRRPLSVLVFESLPAAFAACQLDALLLEGRHPQRVVFRHCVLPDGAVARLCQALLVETTPTNDMSGEGNLAAVCFEDCELSDLAEQNLLKVLEQCDGRCVVTMDGGTTRASEPRDHVSWSSVPMLRWPHAQSDACTQTAGSCCGEAEKEEDDEDGDRDAELASLRAAVAQRDALLASFRAKLQSRDDRIADLERQLRLQEESRDSKRTESVRAAAAFCLGEAEASSLEERALSQAAAPLPARVSRSRFGFALEEEGQEE